MRFTGTKRKLIALAGIAVLAALTWYTIDPGKVRLVGMVILGSFALRIALTAGRVQAEDEEGRQRLRS